MGIVKICDFCGETQPKSQEHALLLEGQEDVAICMSCVEAAMNEVLKFKQARAEKYKEREGTQDEDT